MIILSMHTWLFASDDLYFRANHQKFVDVLGKHRWKRQSNSALIKLPKNKEKSEWLVIYLKNHNKKNIRMIRKRRRHRTRKSISNAVIETGNK